MQLGDTIAAVSSSALPSGRIIVRCSGPGAFELAARLTGSAVESPGARRVRFRMQKWGVPGWLYVFVGPRSYSGEDLVELHIPGSPPIARALLAELLAAGARAAEPGEFTARAYFNGRLDLTEAEGVAATIAAQSERELAAARQLLAGELARRLAPATELLVQSLGLVEVGIDFSEEDVSFLPPDEARSRIDQIDAILGGILSESARFERLSHEPAIVLAGRPNAGKSTLLNALAGFERAVISALPGATRDAIWAPLALPRGIARLTDIAGLDDIADPATPIESAMQTQARQAIRAADVVVLLIDLTDPRPPIALPVPPHLILRSKSDLAPGAATQPGILPVSAHQPATLAPLRCALDRLAFGSDSPGQRLALNARHVRAIQDAQANLSRARDRLAGSPELLALELRSALNDLGQIAGHISPDDLLGQIFSTFCIGK